jgi:hypothetical protein
MFDIMNLREAKAFYVKIRGFYIKKILAKAERARRPAGCLTGY